MLLNNKWYWRIRKQLQNLKFRVKLLIFKIMYYDKLNRRHNILIDYFLRVVGITFISYVFYLLDSILLQLINNAIDNSIFQNFVVAELGIFGVFLGLHCANIASIYSSKYSDAPNILSNAFRNDKKIAKGINSIINSIIYSTCILIEILMGCNIGWITVVAFVLLSLKVVISYSAIGKRTYYLSDIFRVSEDTHICLEQLVCKFLQNDFFAADQCFQGMIRELTTRKIKILEAIKEYGCNRSSMDNNTMLYFMEKNLTIIANYWGIKKFISRDSSWYRKKDEYQTWHLASRLDIDLAMSNGTPLRGIKVADYYWFENTVMQINKACLDSLVSKSDYKSINSYLEMFNGLCRIAVTNKEIEYFFKQIDDINDMIQNRIDKTENLGSTGIFDQISRLYLIVLHEINRYCFEFGINNSIKSIIQAIDTGDNVQKLKVIRGRDSIEFYKKIIYEVKTEGKRITPDWLVKQYIAQEEYDYLCVLVNIVKTSIEHAYSFGKEILNKKMNYEACIIFARFYEVELELSTFYELVENNGKYLQKYQLDKENRWTDIELDSLKLLFNRYDSEISSIIFKCSSEFALKNWDNRDQYPDFIGECYNHLSKDSFDAIIKGDIKKFHIYFGNLTKLMLIYQEYIRTDFVKKKEMYRAEYAYCTFTAPIVEWAKIGGFAILWGELFGNQEWKNSVNNSFKSLAIDNDEKQLKELAASLVRHVIERKKYELFFDSRKYLMSYWKNEFLSAVEKNNETIHTDSKLVQAYCSRILNGRFNDNTSEIFWIICVNPLLPEEEKYHSASLWEEELYD